jgi:hypothetical protein
MSLISYVDFGAAQAIPAAGLATVTNSLLSVRVEEEQMLVVLRFSGSIQSAAAGILSVGFLVDSVAVPTLPAAAHSLGAINTMSYLNVEHAVVLSKGDHKIALQMNDVGTTGATIDGGDFLARFSVERRSNAVTMGQGVNSKVQLAL